jgi:hypothetical protein
VKNDCFHLVATALSFVSSPITRDHFGELSIPSPRPVTTLQLIQRTSHKDHTEGGSASFSCHFYVSLTRFHCHYSQLLFGRISMNRSLLVTRNGHLFQCPVFKSLKIFRSFQGRVITKQSSRYCTSKPAWRTK